MKKFDRQNRKFIIHPLVNSRPFVILVHLIIICFRKNVVHFWMHSYSRDSCMHDHGNLSFVTNQNNFFTTFNPLLLVSQPLQVYFVRFMKKPRQMTPTLLEMKKYDKNYFESPYTPLRCLKCFLQYELKHILSIFWSSILRWQFKSK